MLFALPIFFIGCSDDDDTPANPQLNIDKEQLNFGNTRISQPIILTSNLSWTAISDKDWCIVSPMAGTGDATLNVNVEDNTNTDGRTATITIKALNASIIKTIKVIQMSGSPSITIDPKVRTFDSKPSLFDINVLSNVEYEIIMPSDSWLVRSVEPKSMQSSTVKFNILENQTQNDRETKVIFKEINNANIADTLYVKQEGKYNNLLGQATYRYKSATDQIDYEKAITIALDNTEENTLVINGILTNPIKAKVAAGDNDFVLLFDFPQDGGQQQVQTADGTVTVSTTYTPLYYNEFNVLTMDPTNVTTLTARSARDNINIVFDGTYSIAGAYSYNNQWLRLPISAVPGTISIIKPSQK